MRSKLLDWARARGYEAGWCGATAAADTLAGLRKLRDEGVLDDAFYRRWLAWWLDKQGIEVSPEEPVIVIAVPRPAHRVVFDHGGQSHELILPPTYHRHRQLVGDIANDLRGVLGTGVTLRQARLPLKALAAAAGVTRYGRNNVAYAGQLGSYVQLVAFAANLPPFERGSPGMAGKTAPALLDECNTCKACQHACPTGAIGLDRFVLHAERCLTSFSELEGLLPEAFGAADPPCLVGCMVCQEVCPQNKGLLRYESLGMRFSEDETAFILGQDDAPPLTPELRAKAEAIGSEGYDLSSGSPTPNFRRNLGAVLRHRQNKGEVANCAYYS